MTLMFSVGKWGGFYFYRRFSWRVCLGWFAFTWFPADFDDKIDLVLGVLDGKKFKYVGKEEA